MMKLSILLATSVAFVSARPTHLKPREVPQEHSHQQFLTYVPNSPTDQSTTDTFLKMNNPLGIQDVVFGLLGNAAAAGGAGKVTNLDCLQQEIADTAFTNAKTAKNVTGMTAALIYRKTPPLPNLTSPPSHPKLTSQEP